MKPQSKAPTKKPPLKKQSSLRVESNKKSVNTLITNSNQKSNKNLLQDLIQEELDNANQD